MHAKLLIYTIKVERIENFSHPRGNIPTSHKNPTCQVGATQKGMTKAGATQKGMTKAGAAPSITAIVSFFHSFLKEREIDWRD
jgi:hypothetical protein